MRIYLLLAVLVDIESKGGLHSLLRPVVIQALLVDVVHHIDFRCAW